MEEGTEFLVGKQGLPCAVETEKLILGAIQTQEDGYRLVSSSLEVDDFHLEKHRRIFRVMRDLDGKGEPIDRVTIARELQSRGELESVDGLSYLISLDDGLPKLLHLDSYCRIVREKAILRRAVIAANAFSSRCLLPDADASVIEDAARFYRELSGKTTKDLSLLTLKEYIDTVGVESFFSPQRLQPTIPLPWSRLSGILGGGLRRSDLVVIAGRPAHGKSAVAGQIAHHAARSGKATALFSLEMDADQLWYRIIAASAEVPLQKWRKNRVSEVERHEFNATAGDIAEMPLWISDKPTGTMGALRAAITTHKSEGKPLDLILIDYVQLMQTARKSDSRAQDINEICRELKLWAKELKIPIVVLAQVRRYKDEDKRPPMLDSLKESGAIEETADIVVFVWAAEKDRQNAIRDRVSCKVRVEVAKQRNGPIGYIEAQFSSRYVRLDEEIEGDRDGDEEI